MSEHMEEKKKHSMYTITHNSTQCRGRSSQGKAHISQTDSTSYFEAGTLENKCHTNLCKKKKKKKKKYRVKPISEDYLSMLCT